MHFLCFIANYEQGDIIFGSKCNFTGSSSYIGLKLANYWLDLKSQGNENEYLVVYFRLSTAGSLKAYLLRQKVGPMFVLLASPRWRWCPGKNLLVSYRI